MEIKLATRTGFVKWQGISPVPGLAVCRELVGASAAITGSRWVVTHISSGRKLPGTWRLRKEAVAFARRLAPITDWRQSSSKLLADPSIGRRVRQEPIQ